MAEITMTDLPRSGGALRASDPALESQEEILFMERTGSTSRPAENPALSRRRARRDERLRGGGQLLSWPRRSGEADRAEESARCGMLRDRACSAACDHSRPSAQHQTVEELDKMASDAPSTSCEEEVERLSRERRAWSSRSPVKGDAGLPSWCSSRQEEGEIAVAEAKRLGFRSREWGTELRHDRDRYRSPERRSPRSVRSPVRRHGGGHRPRRPQHAARRPRSGNRIVRRRRGGERRRGSTGRNRKIGIRRNRPARPCHGSSGRSNSRGDG